jgi:hypothetical protein
VDDDAVLARVGNLLDGERADPAGALVALEQLAHVDVGERVSRDDHDRLVAEEFATLRTPPAVPSSSSS